MRLLVEAANASIGVDGGRIVPAHGRFEHVLAIPDGEVRPGLINAHDHLHRNHYGRLGCPPYANAYEWGHDIHRRDAAAIALGRRVPRDDALLAGAWKNLFAGVTTVVHHDPWERRFDDGFPLRVARVRCAHSLGMERDDRAWAPGHGPFTVHLAEGIDDASAEEVRVLDRRGLLTSKLLAVHVVGADDDGIERLRTAGAAIVWCPTSNEFLFGRTVPEELLADGTDVLLGSDSRLTGDGDLLDELRAARATGLLSDERLEAAVGALAARRLGLAEPSLEYGTRADLVVLRRPLLEANAGDVALVVAAGMPRLLDPELVPALGHIGRFGRCLTVEHVRRWVCDAPGAVM